MSAEVFHSVVMVLNAALTPLMSAAVWIGWRVVKAVHDLDVRLAVVETKIEDANK